MLLKGKTRLIKSNMTRDDDAVCGEIKTHISLMVNLIA